MLKKLLDSFIKLFSIILSDQKIYAKYRGVKMGKGCRIYITKWGAEPFLIKIGDRVTITKGVIILTHDGSSWLIRDHKGRRYLYRKVIIGNNVFIGVNSIIMPE